MTRLTLRGGVSIAALISALSLTLPVLAEAPATAPADPLARHQTGNLVMEGIPAIPPELNDELLSYQNARSAGFSGWAPGGGMLVSTRFGETGQVHRVDMPMGMRRQLTFFSEPVAGGSYPDVPNPEGFLFAKDTGGDENYQIYYYKDATGEVTRISAPGARNTGAVWSKDGKKVAWTVSSQKNSTYQVFVADITNPEGRTKIFEREGSWEVTSWSPDGTKMVLSNGVSANESYLYLLDVASGALSQINKQDGQKISYGGGSFSPDGNYIYYTSDEGSEFHTLTRFTIADGSKTKLSGNIPWDVEAADLSPDGSLVVFSVNENGASRIYLRKTGDGTDLPAPQLPPGGVGGLQFSADGSKVGFGLSSAKSAGDAWSFEVADPTKLTRWTESELGGLNPSAFTDPITFSYKSFDGKDIPAFIYKPEGKGPFPVVINIHGGPEGQSRPGFSPLYQYWMNKLGIAIVVPNVRGSSGYGKTYLELDNGFNRKDSVKDIGALLDWIATQPDLNKDKVMVYGGSYGGYMVNACMVDYSDRLAGGISVVGISNFVTFLENTSGYRQDLRRVEYGDERDPKMRAFQEEIAPAKNAGKISKPMFIIHGANDPRVPVTEAEALFNAVKANGQSPWWLVAMDEGHGFRKKSNRDFMNAAMALFLKQRLLGQ